MSVFDLIHTKNMLTLCTPYSYKLDDNRKRIGYKDQSSLLLPFYQYIDNNYNIDWTFSFKNGSNEGDKFSNSRYTESHILVSSKGSIIHLFASNDLDRNPFDKDTSLSMYPFALFNKSYFTKLTDNNIGEIMTNKIFNSSNCHACILVSKFENTENDFINLDKNIVNIVNYAPFGNISKEYLESLFNLFQTYLNDIRGDFVSVEKI
jgi:hypothetical protein